MKEPAQFSKKKRKFNKKTSSHTCENLKLVFTMILTCNGATRFSLGELVWEWELSPEPGRIVCLTWTTAKNNFSVTRVNKFLLKAKNWRNFDI
jgi:hypothetical protein